jgi:hypothetical protein
MKGFSQAVRLAAITLVSFALAACSANNVSPLAGSPSAQAVIRHASSEPTLYILNREVGKTAGWVAAYSDAGAHFLRKFGIIKNETFHEENYADMTADGSGHLYLYQAKTRGQLLVYQKYGASILQTIQYKQTVFSKLTLDRHGNLFAGCEGKRTLRVCEFPTTGHAVIEDTPSRKLAALPYWVATDPMGDVGAAGGANGFAAFAPNKVKKFWSLNDGYTLYLNIAFDSSNNLYVVEEPRSEESVQIAVYARGATTPTYSITDGAYAPGQLAFDGLGNLYVLNYCASNCGTIQHSISIFAPGATTPETVLQPPPNFVFDGMAVSKAGYLAVMEHTGSTFSGPVVVYAPGATTPTTTISSNLQNIGMVAFGE